MRTVAQITCPRTVTVDGESGHECGGLVPVRVTEYPGSLEYPPEREIEVGACSNCGADDWTDDEYETLAMQGYNEAHDSAGGY